MNRVAIAFTTKDRVELTRRTIEPLLQPDKFDLHWIDGSTTEEGKFCPYEVYEHSPADRRLFHTNVVGGSCRAIVYALTAILAAKYNKTVPYKPGSYFWNDYTHIGLVENDVLLDHDWFEPTMALFEQGEQEGLKVGAVSARNFEDRVLIQRDGYSINHNLGAGCIIFTCEAAELILNYYRTCLTLENRKTFSILSGVDIGNYWAFKDSNHMLVADWNWDRVIAEHGMCSLALTPSKATHLEDLDAMGLKLVREPLAERVDPDVFKRFCGRTAGIRYGDLQLPDSRFLWDASSSSYTIFAHQLPMIGAEFEGDWRYKWCIGFGCFAWVKGNTDAKVTIPVTGDWEPIWSDENTFHGIRCRDPQPVFPKIRFDFNTLPPL